MGSNGTRSVPGGVWLMAATEFWERFSYYGFMGIVALFMVDTPSAGGLGIGRGLALLIFGIATGVIWIAPVLGGWVADRTNGHRLAVQWGCASLAIGNAFLAASSWSAASAPAGERSGALLLFALGVATIIAGAGLFKSNASALLGQLFSADDPRRERGFILFYMGINLGALIAPLGAGTVGERIGWAAGFATASLAMAVGFVTFYLGRQRFFPRPPAPQRNVEPGSVAASRLLEDPQARLIVLMACFACIYMSGQMTYGGLMNLYAADRVDREIGGFVIPATWFLALNPLLVILLGTPVANSWQRRSARTGRLLFVEKIATGLVLMALSFLFLLTVDIVQSGDQLRSPLVLIVFYCLITTAELCVLPAGLVEISRRAPARFVGILMGVWILTMGVGSLLAGVLGAISERTSTAVVFAILTAAGLVAAAGLLLAEPRIRRRLEPSAPAVGHRPVAAQAAGAGVALIAAIALVVPETQAAERTTTSYRLGDYRSANPDRFSSATRRSQYVAMRDGVRLAVDVYLPGDASVSRDRRPVVLEFQRYGRAVPRADGGVEYKGIVTTDDGRAALPDDPDASTQAVLLRHGYAFVVADLRGAGASFGPTLEEGDPYEERDLADLIAWIAPQPWSSGRVGMYGVSYGAEVQPRATVSKPEALRALAMVQGLFDEADGGYAMGGVFRHGWLGAWEETVDALDNRTDDELETISNIAPVDDDRDGMLLRAAVREHKAGVPAMVFGRMAEPLRRDGFIRDRLPFIDRRQERGQNNLYTLLPLHNASGVPTLLFGGWNDMFPDDMLLWFENLTVPRRLVMGAWAHGGNWGPARAHPMNVDYRKVARETLRWFDRWLRDDARSAVEAMPPIQYAVFDHEDRSVWTATGRWPIEAAKLDTWYLSGERMDSARSQNDGSLAERAPSKAAQDAYRPDARATTGSPRDGRSTNRWHRKPYASRPDMTDNDWKALTYTSAPLEKPQCVVGNPLLTLFVSSETLPHASVHAYVEAVTPDGRSRYLTEGLLRTTHRKLGRPPYRNFDLPFPIGTEQAIAATEPLSARPVELRFRALATAYRFGPGERLRLALTLHDADNTAVAAMPAGATLDVHHGGQTPSRLELPLVDCPRDAGGVAEW